MVAADWTTLVCVQVGSPSKCRLGPQGPGTVINCLVYLFFGQTMIYTTYHTIQLSSHATLHILRPPVGSQCQFPKNAYIRVKLQKNVVASTILLESNLHCLGNPTCTQTLRNRGPNLHPGKCWPISCHHLWVWSTTSWDPTGAAKSANQGWKGDKWNQKENENKISHNK